MLVVHICLLSMVGFSGQVGAYDEVSLKKIKALGNCPSCDLSEANLEGANLRGANLSNSNLEGANLKGAYLSNSNLKGANLEGADLWKANLFKANLKGADLKGANLYKANLRGANLTGANLEGANLRGASLTGANLEGENLTGANLEGESLTGADLSPACYGMAAVCASVVLLDERDKQLMNNNFQNTLEYSKSGNRTGWSNPDSGHSGTTVARTATQSTTVGYEYCREFTTTVNVAGEDRQGYGTACRKPDGSWEIQ